jgi:hypothetical protein
LAAVAFEGRIKINHVKMDDKMSILLIWQTLARSDATRIVNSDKGCGRAVDSATGRDPDVSVVVQADERAGQREVNN